VARARWAGVLKLALWCERALVATATIAVGTLLCEYNFLFKLSSNVGGTIRINGIDIGRCL